MDMDIALGIDLATHQKAQALMLELSIVSGGLLAPNPDFTFIELLSDYALKLLAPVELRVAYRIWISSQGFGLGSQFQEDWRYERTLNFTDLLSALKNKGVLQSDKISLMVDFLQDMLNDSVVLSSQSPNISASHISTIEEAFSLFDEEGYGFLDMDKSNLLLCAIIAASSQQSKQQHISLKDIQNIQLQSLIFEGKLTSRSFKVLILLNYPHLLEFKHFIECLRKFKVLSKNYLDSSIISKALYFCLGLSSPQKTCWLQLNEQYNKIRCNRNKDKLGYEELQGQGEKLIEAQTVKKFRRSSFAWLIMKKTHAKILYLFILANFEALHHYFAIMEEGVKEGQKEQQQNNREEEHLVQGNQDNKSEELGFGNELSRIFSQGYSQNSALLTFTPSLAELFTVFTRVYRTMQEATKSCIMEFLTGFIQEPLNFYTSSFNKPQQFTNLNSIEEYIPKYFNSKQFLKQGTAEIIQNGDQLIIQDQNHLEINQNVSILSPQEPSEQSEQQSQFLQTTPMHLNPEINDQDTTRADINQKKKSYIEIADNKDNSFHQTSLKKQYRKHMKNKLSDGLTVISNIVRKSNSLQPSQVPPSFVPQASSLSQLPPELLISALKLQNKPFVSRSDQNSNQFPYVSSFSDSKYDHINLSGNHGNQTPFSKPFFNYQQFLSIQQRILQSKEGSRSPQKNIKDSQLFGKSKMNQNGITKTDKSIVTSERKANLVDLKQSSRSTNTIQDNLQQLDQLKNQGDNSQLTSRTSPLPSKRNINPNSKNNPNPQSCRV